MEQIPQQIINILRNTTFQTLTQQEQIELDRWLAEDEQNKALWLRFSSQDVFKKDIGAFSKYDWEHSFASFEEKYLHQDEPKIKKFAKSWYVAAATLTIGLLIGVSYYIVSGQYEELPSQAIVPAGNHAEMLLSNGERIVLDDTSSLTVIDGTFNKNKAFSQSKQFANAPLHFSIVTPRGKKYGLQLPDGTKVWMNADTRIAYDEVDNLRRLTLSGEAYFEVTKQLFTDRKGIIGAKPFIVNTKGMQIEVLGTHFNVSAYPNEKIQRTTLLEGKVKVTNGKQAYVLHPGEEVKLEEGKLARKEIATDQSAAWKDGYFIFNDDKLSDILTELSNWYDVDVVYLDEEVKEERFEGMLSRNSQLKDIINVLESTDRVTFKFKKRTIYVSKK